MFKKFILLATIILYNALQAHGTINFYEWKAPTSVGGQYYDMFYVAPSGGDLVLQYLFAVTGNPVDTSGYSHNGTVIGMTYIPATNGLSAYYSTVNATNTITSSFTDAKISHGFWANTNTWKYYEYINGTQFVNRVAQAYPTNEFFTVAGDVLTIGGGVNKIAQYHVWKKAIDNEESFGTNRASGARLGAVPQYLADNPTQDSNCVYAVTFNNCIQDGSITPLTFASTNYPTVANVTLNNGAGNFIGGSNSYIECNSSKMNEILTLTNAFTIAGWVNTYDTYWGGSLLVSHENSSLKGIGIWASEQVPEILNLKWYWRASAGVLYTFRGSTILNDWSRDNCWHHFVVTYNGLGYTNQNNLKMYVDTSQETIVNDDVIAVSSVSVTNSFKLGKRDYGTPFYLRGQLDEVMVFTNVFTAAEVTNLYLSQTNLYPLTPTPETPYWSLWVQGFTNNQYYSMTITNAVAGFTIDWGDGSVSNISGGLRVLHKYADTKLYNVKLQGTASGIYLGHDGNTRQMLKNISNPISSGVTGITDVANLLYNAIYLSHTPTNLISELVGITNFTSFTYNCAALQNSPVVDTLTNNIVTLGSTWRGCTTIKVFPEVNTLTNVTTLNRSWYNCSSGTNFPAVSNLTKVVGGSTINALAETWYSCSASKSFPEVENLTGVTALYSTWWGCNAATGYPSIMGLTNLTWLSTPWSYSYACEEFPEIPSSVTNIEYAWSYCSSAKSFPVISNLNLGNMYGCWYGCGGYNNTNFPYVNNQTNVKNLYREWAGCNEAEELPEVSNLINVVVLQQTWYETTNVISYPYVNTLTNVTTLEQTWYGCARATSFPAVSNLTKVNTLSETWNNCNKGTDFPDVNTMTNVTTLYWTWLDCAKMTDAPAVDNLISNTSLRSTWGRCYALTNAANVDTMTNVTTFQSTWGYCYALTNMPFTDNANFDKVTTYIGVFNYCTNMHGNFGNWTWRTNILQYDSNNSLIGYTNRPGCLATNVRNAFSINVSNSKMPQDDVSQILIDLDASGASNLVVNVGGTTAVISNATPNAAGWTSVTNIRTRGGTVTVN